MTTFSCVQRKFYFVGAVFAILATLPWAVNAQETTLATTSEGVSVVEEATSTTVTTAPWFQVDKLGGDNQPLGDFVVGPGKAEISVKPGQSYIFYMTVANRISDNRQFLLEVEDIQGSDDPSKSVVLMGEETGPYTLKSYISFPEKAFTIGLGERARIPVTITIPDNASPGGYYGSVLVSTVQMSEEEGAEEATTRSPIIARVGTLFFVTIEGDTIKSGEVKEVSLKNGQWWYEEGPISFNVLYENTGSVHLNPYGDLRVKNIFGEEVGFVELEPWFVLPKSLRTREIVWSRETLFGRYTATFAVNRGYDDIVDERTVVFWVLPWKVLGAIFVTVFIVLLILRLFFRRFEFKRKT